MNLSLQDPFSVAKEYPDTLVHTLQYGHSVCIQFNRKGDYLASGLSDGTVIIYDLLSYAIICVLRKDGHVRPITSLTWSHCGRYLLSSSQDWSCILWDLQYANARDTPLSETTTKRSTRNVAMQNPAIVEKIRFGGPIWSACLHPRNPFLFTASLFEDSPVYVKIESRERAQGVKEGTKERGTEERGFHKITLSTEPKVQDEDDPEDTKSKHQTLVTIFSTSGDYLLCGTSKGWLNVIDAHTIETVHSVKVANCNIKSLVVSPNGRKLAVNCSDRIIRQIHLPDFINNKNPEHWDFDVEHRYQDVVNRLQWNGVTFNANSDFLVASTFGQSSQDLYLWETGMGSLIKILEGSQEELIDVKWNYNKCMIGSTGLDTGTVYLWSIQFPSKWSALAPDFVEIEENEEYQERENEFDILDETEVIKKRMEEEDLEIDILSNEQTDVRGFDTQITSFVIPINYESSVVNV